MKRIDVELSQVGTEEFISQSSINIKANGRFVKHDLLSIVTAALDIKNNAVKVEIALNTYNFVNVAITTKNYNSKEFRVKRGLVTKGGDLTIDHTCDFKDIKSYMIHIGEEIQAIERWVEEVHTVTKNYYFHID